MKCINEKGLGAYQVKRNLKKLKESLRKRFGVRKDCFGRETEKYRERDQREMNSGSHRGLIQATNKSRQMQVSRGIEGFVKVGIDDLVARQLRYRGSYRATMSQIQNRSSIDPAGVEELSRMQELSRLIHQVSRRCRDCDKKKMLEKLDKQKGIEEVSRRCRASFSKQFFEM